MDDAALVFHKVWSITIIITTGSSDDKNWPRMSSSPRCRSKGFRGDRWWYLLCHESRESTCRYVQARVKKEKEQGRYAIWLKEISLFNCTSHPFSFCATANTLYSLICNKALHTKWYVRYTIEFFILSVNVLSLTITACRMSLHVTCEESSKRVLVNAFFFEGGGGVVVVRQAYLFWSARPPIAAPCLKSLHLPTTP